MRVIGLEVGHVRYPEVRVPTGFFEAFRGLRATTGPMLFRGRSVHGFGMNRSLTVVALSTDLEVLSVWTLRPGSVLFQRHAAWMLELEGDDPVPSVGDRATTYAPADDGTAGGVRNADRESGRRLGASRRHAG